MPDFPSTRFSPLGGTIHTYSMECMAAAPLWARKAVMTTSTAWGTANRAIYIPFAVEATVTAYQMAVENGATLGGNVDVGIYDELGTRLVSNGSVAQAGTSTIQTFDIANTVLTPGTYFMAMATNSTTATYIGSVALLAELWRTCGVQMQDTAFALPATATFANPAQTALPALAVSIKSVI